MNNLMQNSYLFYQVELVMWNLQLGQYKQFDDLHHQKYHPDKVIHLGKEHQEGAEEKFRQVQNAYEKLQKERGF